ncbi:MAG: hypothetical protein A3F46_04265 [Legionellales bacterium RIFCSPHIGHO2_12_FULL_42_9]|nr:MAG: hypothetical protein A3F46_04265 [Legionellales bacterium RIFCSPHIGHO2_12_FULL_42_9]
MKYSTIILGSILTISSFGANANNKMDPYSLIDGYDFDIKCAHGNYAKSSLNSGLCYSVIQQSVYAFYMATGAQYNERTTQCYYKHINFAQKTLLMGIKEVEYFYNKHPEYLSLGIAYAFHLSTLNKYPIPKKCLSQIPN